MPFVKKLVKESDGVWILKDVLEANGAQVATKRDATNVVHSANVQSERSTLTRPKHHQAGRWTSIQDTALRTAVRMFRSAFHKEHERAPTEEEVEWREIQLLCVHKRPSGKAGSNWIPCAPGNCPLGVGYIPVERLERRTKQLSVQKRYGKQRLMRDLQQCLRNPLPAVVAMPVFGNNFFEWHGNLRAPPSSVYFGSVFHVKITFKHTYPRSAPSVDLCTPIDHPNVWGTWICLDMLQEDWIADDRSQKKDDVGTGWTEAYTVQTVLLQLQSFLFEGQVRYGNAQVMRREVSDTGKLQSLVMRMPHTHAEFTVTEGFTERQSRHPPPVHSIVSYTFKSLDPDRLPLFPKFRQVRPDLSWEQLEKDGESVHTYGVKRTEEIKTRAAEFECECGHSPSNVYPSFQGDVLDWSFGGSKTGGMKRYEEVSAPAPEEEEQPATAPAPVVVATPNKTVVVAGEKKSPPPFAPVVAQPIAGHTSTPTLDKSVNPEVARLRKDIAAAERHLAATSADDAVSKVKHRLQIRKMGKRLEELCPKPKVVVEVKPKSRKSKKTRVRKTAKPTSKSKRDAPASEKEEIEPEEKANPKNAISMPSVPMHQWQAVFQPGAWVDGVVVKVLDTGALVEVGWRTFAFLPVTQVRRGFVADLKEEHDVQIGHRVKAQVIEINHGVFGGRPRMTLSLLVENTHKVDPSDLVVGMEVDGVVTNMTLFGVFVDIGCGFDGLLRMDQLQKGFVQRHLWEPKDANMKNGRKISVVVRGVNIEDRKLKLELSDTAKRDLAPLDVPNRIRDPLASIGQAEKQSSRADDAAALRYSPFYRLADDVVAHALSFLDQKSHFRVAKVCRFMDRMLTERRLLQWTSEELVCFHSRKNWKEDTLGYGVTPEMYENSGVISGVTPQVDGLLSFTSHFSFEVKRSVWKVPFSHWLPLYICPQHAEKAMPLAKDAFGAILRGRAMGSASGSESAVWFRAEMVLKILPALMNTMVVDVMQGTMHESLVALEGYTSFFHLLSAFVLEYPELKRIIDEQIAGFLEAGETGRNKKAIPSLGEWLALLSVSDRYTWADVCHTYLQENFDRNVKWTLIKYPDLLYADVNRVDKTKKATIVSIKLLMFHVFFLRTFRQDPRDPTKNMSLQLAKKRLDAALGKPTPRMSRDLQLAVKRIKQSDSWREFFHGIGLPEPSPEYLHKWLTAAARNSLRRRYHKPEWVDPALKAQMEEKERVEQAKLEKNRKKRARKLKTGLVRDEEDMLEEAALRRMEQRQSRDGW